MADSKWVLPQAIGKTSGSENNRITHVIASLGWVAHAATQIGVDREDKGLYKKTPVKRHGVEVDFLRFIEDSRFPGLGKT